MEVNSRCSISNPRCFPQSSPADPEALESSQPVSRHFRMGSASVEVMSRWQHVGVQNGVRPRFFHGVVNETREGKMATEPRESGGQAREGLRGPGAARSRTSDQPSHTRFNNIPAH